MKPLKSIFNFRINLSFRLLGRVYLLAKPYKKKVLAAIFLTMLMAVLGPLRPYLIQFTIDEYIAHSDIQGVYMMSALIFLFLLVGSGAQMWSTILTSFLGQNVIKDLRMQVYTYLTGLKLSFYDRTPVGTLVTRTISDIETIADVFSEGLINISGDLLQIIFILGMMFGTDWKLALVSLSVLPLLLYSSYVFKEKVRISFESVRTQVARLNTFVQEHIQGMQVVQIFNREERELEQFIVINKEHRNANVRGVLYYSVFFPVVEIIAAISTALIVWYGSRGVIAGETSIGVMVAFIMYIGMFFRPVRQLADRFNTLQMGMVAAERIFKLVDEAENVEESGKSIPHKLKGDVEFRQVYFGYAPGNYVLKDINIKIPAGKTIALVGATGAGKSSVISLLTRLYEMESGEVLIDGKNIQDYRITDLRKQVAVVLQDVFLFSGSVMDNVKLYHEDISDEKVIETAKTIGAHYFISRLPNGYQQEVRERGATLSVGQRQLISFIRAMATDPAILVLDEATSSIDHESEFIIQQAIEKMMRGRTSIVIAHRLSTIRQADEIIVLDKGNIVERGTHDDLLLIKGYYHRLYELQYKESETSVN